MNWRNRTTVRDDVAITGEITLTGQVLPIGGLEEKALAVHRNGLTTIIAPALNAADVDELPEQLLARMDSSARSANARAAGHAGSGRRPRPAPSTGGGSRATRRRCRPGPALRSASTMWGPPWPNTAMRRG